MSETLILCGFAFLAGLVDAVVGGGGLLQVPALMAILPAAPIALILGTNKLSSIAGTAAAALRFGWSVPIDWRAVIPATVLAGIGASFGARLAVSVDGGFLKPVVVGVLLIMLAHTLMRRQLGSQKSAPKFNTANIVGLSALGSIMGFYDGFLGPGTGSMLIFGLVKLFRYDFLSAAATTKVLNLATNFGALVVFAATDNVAYGVGLPMAAMNILGSSLGAHLAIKGGNQLIRAVFLAVVGILIVKILLDLVSGP
ncbi:MAG: TSUP family transporter [Burkholderiales bacterium]